MKKIADKLPLVFFILACAFVVFGYGVAVGRFKVFPYQVLAEAQKGLQKLRPAEEIALLENHHFETNRAPNTVQPQLDKVAPGVNLISRFNENLEIVFEIKTLEGELLNAWTLDWFEMWPDPDHLEPFIKPKSRPGTNAHGVVIVDNGDVVFNFEHRGLIRLNPQGEVVWRLPYQTHHSLAIHEGNLWLCGQKKGAPDGASAEYRRPYYDEYTVVVVSMDGEILEEWSIPELLAKDGRLGLYPLGQQTHNLIVRDDQLHLNDVEPFPEHLEPGYFGRDDIMVSLRNVNTVFSFNRKTEEITYISTGLFDLHHDPDFLDGNRFSIYDNGFATERSRIIIIGGRTDDVEVYYEGTIDNPFYSVFMGKTQWLENGNVLVTESTGGRAFEVTPDGEIVWEYINFVRDGVVGLLQEVQRLPEHKAALYTSGE